MPDDEVNADNRDALARVIDPKGWELYDDPRVVKRAESFDREGIVSGSRKAAVRVIRSGLLASVSWDRKEYFSARKHIIERTSLTGHCYPVEDRLYGYAMHDSRCLRWPSGEWSDSSCIK